MRFTRRLGRRAAGPLLGVVLLGAVGSCELPKPQIPSIGQAAPVQAPVLHSLGDEARSAPAAVRAPA